MEQKKQKIKLTKKIGNCLKNLSTTLASRATLDSNELRLQKHMKYTYGDQIGQVDFLINNVFDYQNNGLPKSKFFIDLACAHPTHINNTYFLEKNLGWHGLLFEPNPRYQDSIARHRSSRLITDCVTDKVGETVMFRIDNGMLGGIVSDDTDNNEKVRGDQLANAEIIEISTTTLEQVLDNSNAQKLIDFLSLDIEGAEYLALKNFPFDRYQFRCMAIENPNKDLDLLLDLNGYRQVAHLYCDVIYVHSEFIEDINFAPNTRFAFTPPKGWSYTPLKDWSYTPRKD